MKKKRMTVKVNQPLLKGNEKKNLLSCLKDNSISSTGKFVIEFEKKFAKYLNRKYAIAVSSGTAACAISRRVIKFKKRR